LGTSLLSAVCLIVTATVVASIEVARPSKLATVLAQGTAFEGDFKVDVPADANPDAYDRVPSALPFSPNVVPRPPKVKPSRKVRPVTRQPAAEGSATYGPPGETGPLGIPVLVLEAYQHAEQVVAQTEPACRVRWFILAGIGHTESGHAQSGRVKPDGTTRGRILGPRLDGHLPGNAVIKDTDKGVLDRDKQYDRAVGPMQFIPSTWAIWGVDANGDGKADPNNIFDATVAAAYYLCAGGRDLAKREQVHQAILSYNHSEDYYRTVLSWALAYRARAVAIANSELPIATAPAPKSPSERTPKPARSTPGAQPSSSPPTAVPASAPSSSSPQASTPSSSSASTPSSTASTPSSSGSTSSSASTPASSASAPTTASPSPSESPSTPVPAPSLGGSSASASIASSSTEGSPASSASTSGSTA